MQATNIYNILDNIRIPTTTTHLFSYKLGLKKTTHKQCKIDIESFKLAITLL